MPAEAKRADAGAARSWRPSVDACLACGFVDHQIHRPADRDVRDPVRAVDPAVAREALLLRRALVHPARGILEEGLLDHSDRRRGDRARVPGERGRAPPDPPLIAPEERGPDDDGDRGDDHATDSDPGEPWPGYPVLFLLDVEAAPAHVAS